MSIGTVLAAAVAAAGKTIKGLGTVNIPATAKGKNLDGIAYVRFLANKANTGIVHWTSQTHAARVFDAFRAGAIAPWRWVPVQVDPRLVVWTMHDALSIGDSPPARIPINESNCQRLADRLGKQLGHGLLLPTPRIADAVHLAAVQSGRALDVVSIWNDKTEPAAPGTQPPRVKHQGQNIEQWLRQQERIKRAVASAGGYPSAGILSTVGKDVILSPRIVDVAKPGYRGVGEPGPRMMIYGWHTKQKPAIPPPPPQQNPGPWAPHDAAALTAAGWLGIQQGESDAHADMDQGADTGMGGFWDYSSTVRFVHGICLLDGAATSLTTVYAALPQLVYRNASRPVPSRYPMLPVPVV